jgi:alginate O-acetyltransferase complex protein AlgI
VTDGKLPRMLFNSYIYLLLFLPVSVVVYTWLRQRHSESALLWLNLCSFFFYGWWNPAYLPLLLASITINFYLGKQLSAHTHTTTGKYWLLIGILLNLGLLGYFKYTDFALANLNSLLGTTFQPAGIILPLAISFFTFNQIAFLVDAREGMAKEYRFNHYCLFVTFFPHLLAGPIVHHRELIPQFLQTPNKSDRQQLWAVAITIIAFGLFKKVILADSLGYYADQVFAGAANGHDMNTTDAWIGVLAFTLQVYFDFSAYCDIAYGTALFFGIQLPQNFLSPYKSANIIDFWKRWHITLGRFITSYLYTPLMRASIGGVTFAKAMMVTLLSMTLVGLWHGAGWNFILFGVAHGLMLIINHLWRSLPAHKNFSSLAGYHLASVALTFLCVMLSLVLFRSDSLTTALTMYQQLFNLHEWQWMHHVHQPTISDLARQFSFDITPMGKILPLLVLLLGWIFLMPNLQQVMQGLPYATNHLPQPATRLVWRPNYRWALLTALALAAALMGIQETGQFIYFQF